MLGSHLLPDKLHIPHEPMDTIITDAQRRLHGFCLREAGRLEKARRADCSSPASLLSGAHCASLLLKVHADSRYSAPRGPEMPQIPLSSDLLDEPTTDRCVCMLQALSPEESAYYSCEENVLDLSGKSSAQFEELEMQYGFLGGSYDQYIAYLNRPDIPRSMWGYLEQHDVKSIAGFSAVAKNNGRQRKLLM